MLKKSRVDGNSARGFFDLQIKKIIASFMRAQNCDCLKRSRRSASVAMTTG
jgi:hypothetical protein